jgi:hypothetical protein
LFRALFDGRALPELVQRLLRRRPLNERRKVENELRAAGELASALVRRRDAATIELQQARAQGMDLGTAAMPRPVNAAQQAIQKLERILRNGQLSSINVVEAAVARVAGALRANASELPAGAVNAARASRLTTIHRRMIDLLREAEDEANFLFQRHADRADKLPRDVQPTEVGNARVRAERYCREMYRVDFDYIWPRLQFVIPETDSAAKRIEIARALVDFAVLSLVFSIVLLGTWLPMLALYGDSPWPFLVLGGTGPLFVGFFYRLVVETQISFGDVVQGVVDRFRFELLKMLHVKAPATLSDERQIWSWLAEAPNSDLGGLDVVWTAPP